MEGRSSMLERKGTGGVTCEDYYGGVGAFAQVGEGLLD